MRIITDMPGRFRLGERVLVHQSPRIFLRDRGVDGIRLREHDCSDPAQHWESRVLGWDNWHECPIIATPAERNPCHADWPFTERALSSLVGPDWTTDSLFEPGDVIKFIWNNRNNLHYDYGTLLEAKIEVAHIAPGDWYVGFPVPAGWTFHMALNEKDFLEIEK